MRFLRRNGLLIINILFMLCFLLLFLNFSEPEDDIDYQDLVIGCIIVFFQIIIIVFFQKVVISKNILIPLSVGFSFMLNSYWLDTIDEFRDNSTILNNFDTYFILLGLLFISLGVFYWLRLNDEKFKLSKQREALYKQESISDEKTGLYNSRHFSRVLPVEIEHSLIMLHQLSLLILDVDDFKKYNDKYGHPAGDDALGVIGVVISDCIRDSDFAFRYGGEEFAVLLPGTDKSSAKVIAERIRANFSKAELKDSPGKYLTVSIGLSDYSFGLTPKDFIKRSDDALYQAKGTGKNKVVIY